MLSSCNVILDEAGRVCGKPIVGDRTICNKCQALFDKLEEFDKFLAEIEARDRNTAKVCLWITLAEVIFMAAIILYCQFF